MRTSGTKPNETAALAVAAQPEGVRKSFLGVATPMRRALYSWAAQEELVCAPVEASA